MDKKLTTVENSEGRFYFPLIDALRALAALSVLTLHVIHHSNWTSFPTTGPLSVFRFGDEGVDLFFVISGFVVWYNSQSIFQKFGLSKTYYQIFSLRRAARIFPLYYLTIIIYLILIDDNKLIPRPELLLSHLTTHALFIHNFFADTFSSINGVNWTIALEMQFYIFVALVSPLCFKNQKFVALIFFAALILSIFWRYTSYTARSTFPSEMENYSLFIRSVQLPGVIDEFAAGILLASLIRFVPPIRGSYVALFVAGLSACVLYWVHSDYFSMLAPDIQFATRKTFLAIGFALLVTAACLSQSRIVETLTIPLRYLGKISYGLYLYHLIAIMIIKSTLILPPLSFYILTLTSTIVVSALSWHFFERPILTKVRVWESRRLRGTAGQARLIPSR